MPRGKDYFIWEKDKNGLYNVKSSYYTRKNRIEKEEDKIGPSTSYKVDKKVRKEILKLRTTNKIRNFIWRLCTNSLATNENLFKKKVRVNPLCSICLKEPETVEHICFMCEWTAPVWFAGCLGMRFQKEDIRRVDKSFYKLFCCSSLEDDVKELIAWTCWYIWKERCSV